MTQVAAGLGLLDGCVIDQHFAQRNRYGRLLMIVAQSPNLLGIGVDEDTAAVVDEVEAPGAARSSAAARSRSSTARDDLQRPRGQAAAAAAGLSGVRCTCCPRARVRPRRTRALIPAARRDRPEEAEELAEAQRRPAPAGPRHRRRRRLARRRCGDAGPAPASRVARTDAQTSQAESRETPSRTRPLPTWPSSRPASTAAPTSGPTRRRSTSSSTSGRSRTGPTNTLAGLHRHARCSCCPGCATTPARAAARAASSSG